MGTLFGTDGVRGIANIELTCDLAYRLGQAAVSFLGNTIVIGKDTRISGDMLESSVAAGVMSMGGTALSAGVIPTPAIALLTRELHANGGVVISASHNPPEYNGIKFFNSQGFKLDDGIEEEIEEFIVSGGAKPEELPGGDAVGIIVPIENAADMYIDAVVDSILAQDIGFDGLKIALDVGHGASTVSSEEAFRRLGAEVVVINDEFDGTDINVECGSTCLDPLRKLVAEVGADIGIAHDGDADRVMMIDDQGNEIDGDMIEAVCAVDMKERGLLTKNTVVTTVMCNLGFVHAMRNAGIEVIQTKVGDRYVLEAMLEGDYVLGGEQSGHVIMLGHNSTGDGLLIACQFMASARRSGKTFGEAAAIMKRFPQSLINVKNVDKEGVAGNGTIAEAVSVAEESLGDQGRILVRPSGTEPVIRVMVEAADESEAQKVAESIAQVIEAELSLDKA